MAALANPTAPYGMRAIRQIQAKNTTNNRPAPTTRLSRKREKTYHYFLERVDPILGDCITYLLLEQPTDIPQAMIEFLKTWDPLQPKVKAEQMPRLKPKKELKIFLASSISPIVAKLVNRVAVKLPENLIDFMVTEIESMVQEESLIPDKPDIEQKPKEAGSTQGKPSTQQAQVPASVSEPLSLNIAVFGISGAGKTTLVNSLQGNFSKQKPTIGFRPSSIMFGENTTIRFYDLGGGKRIRDIWQQYYHDVHGIIYVINSASEGDENKETIDVLQQTLDNKYLRGKPLLIFANKQDLPNSVPAAKWQEKLPIHVDYQENLFMVETSAYFPDEIPENFSPDPNIEAGIILICKSILERYPTLKDRVNNDIQEKKIEENRQRLERERKVLRNKIATAFMNDLPPEKVVEMQLEPDLNNIFDEQEGIQFLAAEIGEDVTNFPEIGKRISKLVGYQRLALQIIGGLKSPISKKKTPMTWEEILDIILELRKELNLSEK